MIMLMKIILIAMMTVDVCAADIVKNNDKIIYSRYIIVIMIITVIIVTRQ